MAFPATTLNVDVEVALAADLTASPSTWVWTNVTAYVRAEGIRITRGGFDGQVQSPPSRCEFYVNNTDGRWVPTNPTGAWYGQLTKGTPVRVVVDEGTSSVRWTGFLTSLPPRWDLSETMLWVPVTAAGIMQRLERGSTPLRSPLVREISATTAGAPVAYWPGEDGSGATSIAEFSGGKPMELTGRVVTMGDDGPSGSLPLPEFTSVAGCVGRVPSRAATGAWTVSQVFRFPATPTAETIILKWTTTGSLKVWDVTLTPGSPDTITLRAFDSTSTQQVSEALSFLNPEDGSSEGYGVWFLLVVAVSEDGANLDYNLAFNTPVGGYSQDGTVSSQSAGSVSTIAVHPNSKSDGMHAGHWAVWDYDIDYLIIGDPNPSALDGHTGDVATVRAQQLGNEESVPVEVDSASPVAMGPQGVATFLDLLRECEVASAGRLFENRDPTEFNAYLHLRHSEDFTNQDAVLTLNHDSGHLSPPFDPTDDDQELRNDWTAARSGASSTGTGSSARVVATEGEHSSLTPDNIGTYADSVSVNVQSDDQLIHQAGWRVNLGTVEGLRYPTVTLDFARNPSLISDWIGCDIGNRITITNPPTGIAPDDIDLLIEGWTEVFGPYTWQVQLNCSPYKPWRGFRLAETSSDTNVYLGRLAGDEKCALRADITSTATGATNFDPNFYRWTETADDFPLDIRMGGEVITLSGISTSPAVFVAAGAASHADNAAVTPALYAGGSVRQLILVFAAIRSSGTGTLQTPTGYTRLPIFAATDNVQLFAKVHTGSESNPTVTPSGGAAGDTVSAFTFGFSVVPSTLGTATGTSLQDIVLDQIVQLNASAANIDYGGLYAWRWLGNVNLILGWKQDDYTSIAVPSGYTEILEASTTTGNDQSLYAAYRIDTTPTVTNGGSLAVTGGANAISRSAVVALAGSIQIMTISARSVNGVVKAHSAGALIEVDDPAVLAL